MSRPSTGNKKRGKKKVRKSPAYVTEEVSEVSDDPRGFEEGPLEALQGPPADPDAPRAPQSLSEVELAEMDPHEAARLVRENQEALAEYAREKVAYRVKKARERFHAGEAERARYAEEHAEELRAAAEAEEARRREATESRRAFYRDLQAKRSATEAEVREKMRARAIKRPARVEPYVRSE